MKLAIFDFDGTLLARDTLPTLGKEWLRQKRSFIRYIGVLLAILPVVLRYKLKHISREEFKNRAFDRFNLIFKGMTRLEINNFFENAYPNIKKLFNAEVLKEIANAKRQGFHSVLLSGSYADLLRVIADDLGIDNVIAAELVYRDNLIEPGAVQFINGRKKVELLQQAYDGKNINWNGSRCFADSMADIELMQLVGEPVAICPDQGLLTYALDNRWKVTG